jgi:CheY-like chemotaxis protein
MLRFSIKDTGMGFPKEQLDTIFMPFRQIDHPSVAKGSGVGLGLSICKKLVQLMHGDISAESQPGIGTTFTFTAVFRQVEDGTVYESQSMQAAVDFTNRSQPLHILVVEDNAVNQLVVRQMLQTAGCRVTIVVNGQEALEFLLHNSVDLILMDVQLPVMDGYETTRKIRTLEGAGQRKPVPIIAITANALKGDSERCLEAGMNAYLSKPFSRNALLSAIGSLVSG